ncbi:DUF4355 domain-containing protein [Companilactobacillus baiquanensis]|uniref:DUF4355 domain-containing protein n=1 Tax=Companilactobacillus baiquanensis TaxID=2486005 RepID=A0ABW1UWD4_9LACO|nr:DUF4355 domain-containing protein [Companilactobacillus baiquanensis]
MHDDDKLKENMQADPTTEPKDDISFDEKQQSKVDELVISAKNKEKAKAKIEIDKLRSKIDEMPDLINAAIQKHDKEENMTDKEKADAEKEELKKQVADLTAEKAKRTRLETARHAADEKGLPQSFAELFVGSTDEETQLNLDKVKNTFDKAVQDAVEKRLSGKKTPQAPSGTSVNTNKAIDDMSLEELSKLALTNPDAVKGYLG